MYKDHDKENMYGSIWNFPDNLKDALTIGENISLKNRFIILVKSLANVMCFCSL